MLSFESPLNVSAALSTRSPEIEYSICSPIFQFEYLMYACLLILSESLVCRETGSC